MTSDDFVLEKNVLILASDVNVVSVEERSVTLSGNVPELPPDTVIIKNEGELVFERKVVSAQQSGSQVVVQTVPAALADIFTSANIQQTEVISSEVMAQLQPAIPGFRIAPPPQGKHQSVGGESSYHGIFDHLPVTDRSGNVVGYLDGIIHFIYGFEQSVVIKGIHGEGTARVTEFQMIPFSHYSGDVIFTAVADGSGGGSVKLTEPITFPLAKMGQTRASATCQLFLRWTGDVESGVKFRVTGGDILDPLGNPGVETRVGQRYFVGMGGTTDTTYPGSFTEFNEFDSKMTGTILKTPESNMDFDLRIIEIRSSVDAKCFKPVEPVRLIGSNGFRGINRVLLRQDMLRVQLQSEFTSNTKLACRLKQLFSWTSDQQLTSYSVDPNATPFTDETAGADPDQAHILGGAFPRTLAPDIEVDAVVGPAPVSITVPDLRPTTKEPVARLRRGVRIEMTALGGFEQGEPSFRPTFAEWTSSDPSVARFVKSRGSRNTLQTLAAGQTIIRCKHPSGVSARYLVQVLPPTIESITVDVDRPVSLDPSIPPDPPSRPIDGPPQSTPLEAPPFTGPLEPGTVVQLKATALWSDGAVQDVTDSAEFSLTSGTDSASLEGSRLQAQFPGTVVVQASVTPDNTDGPTIPPLPIFPRIDGQKEFTVRYPEGSNLMLLPRAGQRIGLGSTVGFRAFGSLLDGSFREITSQAEFGSSESSVASIARGGLATGLAAGRTIIQAAFGGATSAVELLVQDPSLTGLSIQSPPSPVSEGATPVFRATGTYADGSSRDVTDRVHWRSANPEILSIGEGGRATALTPGTATIDATLDLVSRSAEVTVAGPTRLVMAGPPPTSLSPNSPFTVTVEVWDLRGRVAGATDEITLGLTASSPTGATLSGQLVRRAVNGVAVFDNLRLNPAGNGFIIEASSPGLSSALSPSLNVGGAPAGHIFVANDNSPVGAVNSLAVDTGGIPTAVMNSPFVTNGRTHAIERISNLVVTADLNETTNQCRLSIFQYNPASGALTPTASSPTAAFANTFQPMHTSSNGTNTVFVLAEFDANVHAIRLDPSNGNVLSTNTQPIPGGAQPNELAFRASTGGGPDLLFVIQGNGGGNNVHAFSYNSATGLLTPGPVTPIGVGVLPGGVTVIGSRLYVTNQGPLPDVITAFNITLATGGLTLIGSVPTGGSFSGALHHFTHPVVGDLLFCANGPPEDTIAAFSINGAGLPVSLGAPVPVGNTNPHQFADLNLGGGRFALYVTASTRVAAFLVDPATAALNAVSASPFAGFNSPFGIAR